ncbi:MULTISPECIES: hypothetical protein [Leucobacter]|uniref:Integral membrane protein n=1 Tax=Leucobacter manosquensis TaxID=2810611 RepID=A0ABS5M7L8_9MICO|nr:MULTISPECIES: hypothetical protein [Leucobacter]MBS3183186.1 hypothetical protein [Leucobacter manosquensis]
MIAWYGVAVIVVALAAAVLCLVEALRRRAPNDFTMGATLLVALALIAQVVVAIAAPAAGNAPAGDPLEFWMYLIVALMLPLGAGFWALVDRTRWANLVLAVVHLSVGVMTYRMLVIWG